MQAIVRHVRASAQPSALEHMPNDDVQLGAFMRGANAAMLTASMAAEGELSETDVDVKRLLYNFMWGTQCCNSTLHVSDTYNSTHLCGMLVCKYLLLYGRAHESAFEGYTMQGLFLAAPNMHIAEGPVHLMRYDSIAQVLTGLQHQWPVLTAAHADSAVTCLLMCMSRFGSFLLFHQPATVLDEQDKREPVCENATLFRPTKRCTRSVVNTCLCLLRNFAMGEAARAIHIQPVAPGAYDAMLYNALFMAEPAGVRVLSLGVRECAARVKRITTGIRESMHTSDVHDSGLLWAYLAKNVGVARIGACPRKHDAALTSFLQDVVLMVAQQDKPSDAELCICAPVMRVVQAALRYFYLVPSADTFRHLALLESVSSGQRLNYSHDYCHFDTGQLSQVVYLHNPLYKNTAPPTSIEDWDKHSCAGPIAAFCQLLPDLQVWYEDCQDPLGIFGDSTHRTKASDNYTSPPAGSDGPHGHTRWVLVMARTRTLLVDRSCAGVYIVPRPADAPDAPDAPEHHALGVLVLYLYKTGQIGTVAAVAINGYKIRFDKNSDALSALT